jgi:hypothetical protein
LGSVFNFQPEEAEEIRLAVRARQQKTKLTISVARVAQLSA